MLPVTEMDDGLTFHVQVLPRSSRNETAGIHGDALKLKITAAPMDGKANEECILLLSGMLGVRKADITILRGHTSRRKTIFIRGMSRKELESILSGVNRSR
ncbi:MAG: DUF167 domain-containing protein [Syntrophales bacterium]|jgi:uncharacterized protein (TIGR00251 family)